jgi:hypothetical protein
VCVRPFGLSIRPCEAVPIGSGIRHKSVLRLQLRRLDSCLHTRALLRRLLFVDSQFMGARYQQKIILLVFIKMICIQFAAQEP